MNRDLIELSRLLSRRSPRIARSSIFSPLLDVNLQSETEPYSLSGRAEERALAPATDIEETNDEFVVTTDLPGVRKEDISIQAVGSQLIIAADRKYQETERRVDLQERYFGPFERKFNLPSDIDSENIEASYENGVLTVCLPKAEKAKPKRIEIL